MDTVLTKAALGNDILLKTYTNEIMFVFNEGTFQYCKKRKF